MANLPAKARLIEAEAFAALLEPLLAETKLRHLSIGVAVSGGPDSMALLWLANRWARMAGAKLFAYSVNHDLRAAAQGELEVVAQYCRSIGLLHRALTWEGEKPATGLQAAARQARYDLLTQACRADQIDHLLLAHHLEDQAETLLMRIEKDSGPDGLAGMSSVSERDSIKLLRPLLSISKAKLLAIVEANSLPHFIDPSNSDPRFLRAGLRDLAEPLARSGVTAERLGRLAESMGRARAAMDKHCRNWLNQNAEVSPLGYVRLSLQDWRESRPVFRERLLSQLLSLVGGAEWPVRSARLQRLCDWLLTANVGEKRTLGGCELTNEGTRLLITREPEVIREQLILQPKAILRWDRRFTLRNLGNQPVRISANGERLRRRAKLLAASTFEPHFNPGAIPKSALFSLPAVTHLDGRVSVPHFVASEAETFACHGAEVTARFLTLASGQ